MLAHVLEKRFLGPCLTLGASVIAVGVNVIADNFCVTVLSASFVNCMGMAPDFQRVKSRRLGAAGRLLFQDVGRSSRKIETALQRLQKPGQQSSPAREIGDDDVLRVGVGSIAHRAQPV